MRILYIDNDGGGFADHVEVADGTTVETFFGERMPSRAAEDYLIRVELSPSFSPSSVPRRASVRQSRRNVVR